MMRLNQRVIKKIRKKEEEDKRPVNKELMLFKYNLIIIIRWRNKCLISQEEVFLSF